MVKEIITALCVIASVAIFALCVSFIIQINSEIDTVPSTTTTAPLTVDVQEVCQLITGQYIDAIMDKENNTTIERRAELFEGVEDRYRRCLETHPQIIPPGDN